jgi:hypothetical protein
MVENMLILTLLPFLGWWGGRGVCRGKEERENQAFQKISKSKLEVRQGVQSWSLVVVVEAVGSLVTETDAREV